MIGRVGYPCPGAAIVRGTSSSCVSVTINAASVLPESCRTRVQRCLVFTRCLRSRIGGVNRTLKIMVGPKWYLEIDLGGPRARAEVDLSDFTKAADGDPAAIRYKKRRISGNLEVTQYLGKPGD